MAKEQFVDIQTGKVTVQENDLKEVALTVDESIVQLRNIRNGILGQSDWVVIKEREEGGSVSNFADWKTYRQALRDITSGLDTVAKVEEKLKQDKDGKLVNFPTAPTELRRDDGKLRRPLQSSAANRHHQSLRPQRAKSPQKPPLRRTFP